MGKKQKQKPKPNQKPKLCRQPHGKRKEPRHHAESLPPDIVYEILLRLSVKLLTKFRCVCKHWCSLISHPAFQQEHYLRRSQQDPLLLLKSFEFNKVRNASTIHLSTYDSVEWTFVNNFSKTVPRQRYTVDILSCQGLVCNWDEKHIIICNPSTRETMILPPTYGLTENIGFGYAASKKQFKIVRFFRPNGFSDTETNGSCEIFTLGTSAWREVRPPPPRYKFLFWYGSPFLHGAIHLLPNGGNSCSADFIDGIVTFDIESEEYTTGKIQLPQYCHVAPLNRSFEYMYLSELGRFLCMTINLGATLSLWLLKDYDNGDWVNEYTIDLSSLGRFVRGKALVILGDGSILLDVSDVSFQGKEFLYCYHPGEKTFTLKRKGNYSVALYVESLVALGNSP